MLRRAASGLAMLGLATACFGSVVAADEPERPQRLRVVAAESIRPAVERVGGLFEQTHKVRVEILGASAPGLEERLERGAVDLMIMASPEEVDTLEQAGYVVPESRREVARNGLVVISAPGGPYPRILHDLLRADFELIAVADPETSVLGRHTATALANLGLDSGLSRRLFRADSTRQLLEYVASGQVPAAIVFSSDAHRNQSRVVRGPDVPFESFGRVIYQGTVTANSGAAELAGSFLDALSSPEGVKILRDEGLIAAP